MKTSTPSESVTEGQEVKFRRLVEDTINAACKKVDMSKESMQRLLSRGGKFEAYVIEGLRRFSTKAPDYGLAQSILGADFITPEEVTKARPSIVYTDKQIMALAESLLSQDTLRWCKDNGYAVIPAPPKAMSILDVREIQSAHFYPKTGGWYSKEKGKFVREDKTSFGWLAIKKTSVDDSTNKNWNEQTRLLSKVEKVPNAAEMSWFITTYFEVRSVRLFEDVYVRTSSLDSTDDRVRVGYFGAEGLYVSYVWVGGRIGLIGVSASRK